MTLSVDYWLNLPDRLEELGTSALVESLTASGRAKDNLHEAARLIRRNHYGHKCIVRGVIELTNICRLSCDYCPMRRGSLPKEQLYVLKIPEVTSALENMRRYPISVASFQSGETPAIFNLAKQSVTLAKKILGEKIEVLLCLGILEHSQYKELKDSGASSYIMKFETSDYHEHQRLRGETLTKRTEEINQLMSLGFNVGTGSIIGLENQSIECIAKDLLYSILLKTSMHSVSPFIPSEKTPMRNVRPGELNLNLNAISTLRILHPNAIIPSVSAFEMISKDGQRLALNAGANVITINFTPTRHANKYEIYSADRFKVSAEHALNVIKKSCLEPASLPRTNQLLNRVGAQKMIEVI